MGHSSVHSKLLHSLKILNANLVYKYKCKIFSTGLCGPVVLRVIPVGSIPGQGIYPDWVFDLGVYGRQLMTVSHIDVFLSPPFLSKNQLKKKSSKFEMAPIRYMRVYISLKTGRERAAKKTALEFLFLNIPFKCLHLKI